jgi:hypothetical protein
VGPAGAGAHRAGPRSWSSIHRSIAPSRNRR